MCKEEVKHRFCIHNLEVSLFNIRINTGKYLESDAKQDPAKKASESKTP